MLGIGTPELMVIGLIIIIFYGPDRLPSLLSKINGVFSDIRHAGQDVRQQLNREIAKVESDIVQLENDQNVVEQKKDDEPAT